MGVSRDAQGREVYTTQLSGAIGSSSVMTGTELDTQGNAVPVFKNHTYTYDGSGNLATDTVSNGTDTWVRTYTWSNGAQSSDSGWVKQ